MRQYTQQDLEIINRVPNENGLMAYGDQGAQNGELISQYLEARPHAPVTDQLIVEAIAALRPQLHFKTALQIAADKAAANFTQADVDAILAFIPSRGLKADGNNLLVNFRVIAEFMTANQWPVSISYLDKALGDLIKPQGRYSVKHDGHLLAWKPRLQDSEKEAQAQRLQTSSRPDDQQQVRYDGLELSPELRAHREMLKRPVENITASTVRPNAEETEWKARAESVSVRSHVETARIQKLFVMKPGTSDFDWELTYRARTRAAEQYSHRMAAVRGA